MRRRESRVQSQLATPNPRSNRGFSLTEVVIAIAIAGILVTAVMASARVSLKASQIDRDRAIAFAWLQAASDEIHLETRVACTADGTGRTNAIAAYRIAAQSTGVPDPWTSTGAGITVSDVEYLGRSDPDDDFSWSQTFCFETAAFVDSPLYTQRVTIDLTMPNGSVTSMQMVKSE